MSRWQWAHISGALFVLAACSSSAGAGPVGWSRSPAAPTTWTRGSGSQRQTYRTKSAPFTGSLRALGRRETISIVLSKRNPHLLGTRPFPACPGVGGISTFAIGGQIIEVAFAIQDGNALTIRYERPHSMPASAAVAAAMQRAICVAPA